MMRRYARLAADHLAVYAAISKSTAQSVEYSTVTTRERA
jgi:hypothetical protein